MLENNEISLIQKQFWILQNLYKDTTAYNIPFVFKIRGSVNKEYLEKAISHLIYRHDMMRARFYEKNDIVYQEVLPVSSTKFQLKVTTLDENFTENPLPEQILEEVHKTFDLTEWPVFRIRLFSFNNNIEVLSIVFHHILIDLFSTQLYASELSALYNSYVAGVSPGLKNVNNNYSGYSLWLKNFLTTEKGKRKLEEWKRYIPQKPDIPEFPTDFIKPGIHKPEGKRIHFSLESVTASCISGFSEKHSVNDFTVLLTAYAIMLNRISNQQKIIIGVPFANRKNSEFRNTFGCFVNIIPLITDFSGNPSGEELLNQIFVSLLKVHQKQEIPFLLLNEVLGGHDGTSLFTAGYTFEPPMQLQLSGADVSPLIIEREGSQLELFLSLWNDGEKINAYLQYSTLSFKEGTVRRFWQFYESIVESLIKDPQTDFNQIPIVPEADFKTILELNKTETVYEDQICIHKKFEEQVIKNPERKAVISESRSLSYRELNERANIVAHELINYGVKAEDIVGICMDRSVEMITGIFGILKAGAAYLPLSPEYPADRIQMIIQEAEPEFILSTKNNSGNIPKDNSILYVDEILEKPVNQNTLSPEVNVSPGNLAYIIYTSGTTGKPKGVMIEHHSVLNRLGWMQKAYPIGESDVILQKTPVVFDVSVWELFWWAFNGASLVLLPKGGEKDPDTIINYIEKFRITTIHFVPSMFIAFFETVKTRNFFNRIGSLKRLFLSGEALPLKLVKEFNSYRGNYNLPQMINLYGPTEATVDVSYFNCPESNVEKVYIGRPIDNTKLFVINEKELIQPIGIPGELVITGVNLARGYYNNPELTRQKFFNLKIKEGSYLRAYRTGDLVKLSEQGEIEYIGRSDDQVKVRGFRVELGDIEHNILEHSHVNNCAVTVAGENQSRSLIAYIQLKPGSKTGEEDIRKFLSAKVPEYMLPSYYVFLDKFPYTPSGKLDRKNLPNPDTRRMVHDVVVPSNKSEGKLLQLWNKLLLREDISVHDNFFDIGGNSLLAITLANLISQEFNTEISAITVFEYPSIKRQAELLTGEKDELSLGKDVISDKMRRRKSVNFRRHRSD